MMKDTCGICSIYNDGDELAAANLTKPSTSMLDTSPSKLDSIVEEDDHAIKVISIPEERDFDQNPTELYLSLMRKDWTAVQSLADSHPEETSVWIYRRESNGKLRWKLLPLHAAIIFDAPLDILTLLVSNFVAAVVSADDQGMVPLHLAVRMGRPACVLELLIRADGTCLDATDRKGRTPRALAAKSPDKEMLSVLDALVMPKPIVETPLKELQLVQEEAEDDAEEKKEDEEEPMAAEQPRELPVTEMPVVKEEPFQDAVQPEDEPALAPQEEVVEKPQLAMEIQTETEDVPETEMGPHFPMTPSAVMKSLPANDSLQNTPSMITMDELRAMHKKEIEILKETHEKELQFVKHSQLNQLGKVQESNQSVVDAIKEEYETKQKSLIEANQALVACVKDQAATEKAEFETQIAGLQETIAQLKAAQKESAKQHEAFLLTHEAIVAEKMDLETTLDATNIERSSSEETNKAVMANLVAQIAELKTNLASLENKRDELEASKSDLETENTKTIASQKETIASLQAELEQVKFLKSECEKALLNAEKLNVELTDKTYTLESTDSDIRVKLINLESKYNEVTASEQELAWKCEALTKKLEEMPTEAALKVQLKNIEKEKADLKETVNKLSVKLYKVVGFLDEMVQEQDQIINASKSGDSEKLLTNVSGMKSQISTVIDSVISNMPSVPHPDEEEEES